jgi:hypothetical protein
VFSAEGAAPAIAPDDGQKKFPKHVELDEYQ